ncbi:hypothetical protein HAX54_013214 [Datura stramonium]|uniref:Uncharacterized protein n=1 Tax=Datura stramonium TaxID=4076 RepID=A0ABS8RYB7_DATST|nr:hypothetical protein [Datura stramonium]
MGSKTVKRAHRASLRTKVLGEAQAQVPHGLARHTGRTQHTRPQRAHRLEHTGSRAAPSNFPSKLSQNFISSSKSSNFFTKNTKFNIYLEILPSVAPKVNKGKGVASSSHG